MGMNTLVGQNTSLLKSEVVKILSGNVKQGVVPPLWDGKASERIAEIIAKQFKC
jgi:UDP-N-acetylglucosamine 2-epimerase (non-hydrolysing)